jgi:AraC-like DNA-binding protein
MLVNNEMAGSSGMQKSAFNSNQRAEFMFNAERVDDPRGAPDALGRPFDEIHSEPGGLRSARIASVMAQIQDGFADQQFSTRVVAAKLGLSVRYVQDLLQGSGSSITDRIMALRLDKASAMLVDDRNCMLKISDVAASCGFNELSYFHRSFRRRFGASPAKYRLNSLNS